jgi:hypothetical protein
LVRFANRQRLPLLKNIMFQLAARQGEVETTHPFKLVNASRMLILEYREGRLAAAISCSTRPSLCQAIAARETTAERALIETTPARHGVPSRTVGGKVFLMC